MVFFLVLAAVFLLAGMVAVSLSLLELDRRLTDLSEAMDGRYGKWLEQAAADLKKAGEKETKDVKGEGAATGNGIAVPPPRK